MAEEQFITSGKTRIEWVFELNVSADVLSNPFSQSTDNGTSHRSMKVFTLTPDSGVPPTPSAGSSSSGGSGGVVRGSGREEGCLGRGHGGLVRQQTAGSCDKPVTYFPLGPNNTASAVIDNNRKQSDSGICATEDSSALPYARHNPRISRSTTTEDVFVDNQGPRLAAYWSIHGTNTTQSCQYMIKVAKASDLVLQ